MISEFIQILRAGYLQTLTDILSSFDFDSDETCALYAEFIDSSPNIKKINFGEGTGNRKISVEFKAAKRD